MNSAPVSATDAGPAPGKEAIAEKFAQTRARCRAALAASDASVRRAQAALAIAEERLRRAQEMHRIVRERIADNGH